MCGTMREALLRHQTMPGGVGGGGSAIRGIRFIEDIGDMRGDGSRADEQRIRDLLVALSLSNETEDLHFARRETIRIGRRRLG